MLAVLFLTGCVVADPLYCASSVDCAHGETCGALHECEPLDGFDPANCGADAGTEPPVVVDAGDVSCVPVEGDSCVAECEGQRVFCVGGICTWITLP